MYNLLYINRNTNPLNVQVISARINIITAHFQSPRNKAGKNPKKNAVHDKPTGASLIAPVCGFSKVIDV
jgi:hypothetical protein